MKELATPPLRPVWANAKKKASEAAKKLKQGDKFAVLEKKFKVDLGPDLEKWPKLFPDFAKLKDSKGKIDATLKQYEGEVQKSGLDKGVVVYLMKEIGSIQKQLDERLKKAEVASKNMPAGKKKGKTIPPIVIFQAPNMGKQIAAKAPEAAKKLNIIELSVSATLEDEKVLKHVPEDLDDALLAQKIKDEADYGKMTDDIAAALEAAAKLIKKGKEDMPAAEKAFKQGLDKAVQDAVTRGSKPILELAQVRTDYRGYKIKTGFKLTLSIAGAIGGIIGLALTPLTLGVSTVAGALGLANSAKAIGTQLADLSMSAEEMAATVAAELKTLHDQYKKQEANSTKVGLKEWGKAFVNSATPLVFTSIAGASSSCGTLKSKIGGLHVKSHDTAQDLGKMLTAQTTLQKQLGEFEKIGKANKALFTTAEASKVEKLVKTVDKSAADVMELIGKISKLNKRVKDTTVSHTKLEAALKSISGKQPKWSEIAVVLTGTVVAAGFLVAGNVNAPEAYKFVKEVADINQALGNAVGSLDGAQALFFDMKDTLTAKKA